MILLKGWGLPPVLPNSQILFPKQAHKTNQLPVLYLRVKLRVFYSRRDEVPQSDLSPSVKVILACRGGREGVPSISQLIKTGVSLINKLLYFFKNLINELIYFI